jgi:hypothetical protein
VSRLILKIASLTRRVASLTRRVASLTRRVASLTRRVASLIMKEKVPLSMLAAEIYRFFLKGLVFSVV